MHYVIMSDSILWGAVEVGKMFIFFGGITMVIIFQKVGYKRSTYHYGYIYIIKYTVILSQFGSYGLKQLVI